MGRESFRKRAESKFKSESKVENQKTIEEFTVQRDVHSDLDQMLTYDYWQTRVVVPNVKC
jgi:hypothetical protein